MECLQNNVVNDHSAEGKRENENNVCDDLEILYTRLSEGEKLYV